MLRDRIIALLGTFCLLAGLCLSAGCSPVGQKDVAALQQFGKGSEVAWNPADYPVTVENISSSDKPEDQTYIRPPKRIVAVWQNSVETLIALGVGDRIIAGMGIPDRKYVLPRYREAYDRIPYKSLQNLDLETIMMMDPDFILGWYSTFSTKVLRGTDFWHKRDVHTYIAQSSVPRPGKYHTLDEEYSYIRDLGKIVGKRQKAEELVNSMQGEIDYAVVGTKGEKAPDVLILEIIGKDLRVYGPKTLAGDIASRLGGHVLEAGQGNLSMEELISMDPDVIFVVVIESDYGQEQMFLDRLYQHKALQSLKAVRGKRIYPVRLNAVYSPGIRAYDGIRVMARGMYPRLYRGQDKP